MFAPRHGSLLTLSNPAVAAKSNKPLLLLLWHFTNGIIIIIINCNKCLCCCSACDVLPILLRGTPQVAAHAQFFMWLEKAVEFFVCYVSQSQPEESGIHALQDK